MKKKEFEALYREDIEKQKAEYKEAKEHWAPRAGYVRCTRCKRKKYPHHGGGLCRVCYRTVRFLEWKKRIEDASKAFDTVICENLKKSQDLS
jgi:hypothetical protein